MPWALVWTFTVAAMATFMTGTAALGMAAPDSSVTIPVRPLPAIGEYSGMETKNHIVRSLKNVWPEHSLLLRISILGTFSMMFPVNIGKVSHDDSEPVTRASVGSHIAAQFQLDGELRGIPVSKLPNLLLTVAPSHERQNSPNPCWLSSKEVAQLLSAMSKPTALLYTCTFTVSRRFSFTRAISRLVH
jgi:hypothetical protein